MDLPFGDETWLAGKILEQNGGPKLNMILVWKSTMNRGFSRKACLTKEWYKTTKLPKNCLFEMAENPRNSTKMVVMLTWGSTTKVTKKPLLLHGQCGKLASTSH
jgi:hypothetical protein